MNHVSSQTPIPAGAISIPKPSNCLARCFIVGIATLLCSELSPRRETSTLSVLVWGAIWLVIQLPFRTLLDDLDSGGAAALLSEVVSGELQVDTT